MSSDGGSPTSSSATSSSATSPRTRASPSRQQRVDWVPLFARTASHAPLATSTVLPPTPRRTSTASTSPTGSSRSSMYDSGRGSPTSIRSFDLQPAVHESEIPSVETTSGGLSSGVAMTPNLSAAQGESVMLQRTPSYQAQVQTEEQVAVGMQNRRHLRRRSSSAVRIGESSMIDDRRGSVKMDRVQSLTSYMQDPLSQKRNSTYEKVAAFDLRRARRRVYNLVTRVLTLSCLLLVVLYFSRRLLVSIPGVHDLVSLHPVPSAAVSKLGLSIPPPLNIYDTLETYPYPTSTHPRTPDAHDKSIISFADYLTTRLGSHFSFPPSKSHSSERRASHLWLTTATNETVRVSTRHLVAFVRRVSEESAVTHLKGLRSGKSKLRGKQRLPDAKNSTSTADLASLSSDATAHRALIVLCRDEGCMSFCRSRPTHEEWYCFGGFMDADKDHNAAGGLDGEERMKLRASIEALESGRRVFMVDSDVYFKEDPVPYLGDLMAYDIQIPDSWTSSKINAGFAFLNPTHSVISLCRRLLDISLSDADERRRYATTNLLLDPTGFNRDIHQSEATHKHDDKEFDTEDHAVVNAGYGQTEFESSWSGGMDVKVLDRQRFRTSSGKLAKMDWMREKTSLAIYHHCVCCGDKLTNDYIAGALGYHQPTVAYPEFNPSSSVPEFPMVIKTTELNGTRAELSFMLGFLLQVAHDSNRGFVPPLKAKLVSETAPALAANNDTESAVSQERYIWRLFPTARWAQQKLHGIGSLVNVHEPAFVLHAIEYLQHSYADRVEAQRQIQDLSETLILDLNTARDYDEAIKMVNRPYFSTTRVVVLDGVKDLLTKGRKDFELREEFQGLSMCRGVGGEVDEDGHGEDGKCVEVCRE